MTQLHFRGKEFVYNHHLSVPYSELKPDAKKSVITKGGQPRLDDNLIIHGDNLRALKALLPRYEGRVNCIYIDPPYNTGNEGWSYNDNVNMPYLKDWLSNNPVNNEDMERHEKWCCMMWPRLTLLHQLLADDGAIFISIDDNEVHHLRMMMDEIFGEGNFVELIAIASNPRGRDYGGIAKMHDYVLVYKKTQNAILNNLPEPDKTFPFKDEDGDFETRELRNRNIAFNINNRPNLYYPFYINPNSHDKNNLYKISLEAKKGWVEIFPKESQGIKTVWRWGIEKSSRFINKEIVGKKMKEEGQWQIVEKYREKSKMARSIWSDKEVNNEKGTLLLKDIFNKKIFDFPKPAQMIKNIIQIATNKNSIILDSFAGSGTTAHAVLALNKENGGDRKFILIECEDYADNITAERVRRVIKGVPTAKNEEIKNGLGGEFTFCELSNPIDFDSLLAGKDLPSYKEFAGLVWNLFAATAFDEKQCNEKEFIIGEKDGELVFCFYKPNKNFLLSHESCLNTNRMEELSAQHPSTNIMIYAPACFVPNDMLKKHNIRFAPLPFALFKLG
ncbi:MAG: site-specific DNA-methyltransferase [Hydrotalea sp.]|nr:site-specific DNA-methyltransferase [Hydrotalea sp.]